MLHFGKRSKYNVPSERFCHLDRSPFKAFYSILLFPHVFFFVHIKYILISFYNIVADGLHIIYDKNIEVMK